jgi:hypothetical protein
MFPISQTPYYDKVLKHFKYNFADLYIFDDFVVSEIREGITFSWDEHGKQITKDVTEYTNCDGSNIVYISHRINSYSIVPTGWLMIYKYRLSLKGYGVFGYNSMSFFNTVIEDLFLNKKIRKFSSLESAAQWAKSFELVEV